MAYIGKTPTIGNFQKCDAITVVNGQAAYTMQVGGSNVSPESENHMLVSLNGILQAPVDSFTISGSTITFASNLATGDVIDFIMLLGNVLDLGTPSDNTVTAAKLNNDIISGQTALTAEPADTDEFLVSDAGTIKRIDYSLIKSSGMTLIKETDASNVSAVTFTHGTDSVVFDSTYKVYFLTITNLRLAGDEELFIRALSGGSALTSGYWTAQYGSRGTSTPNAYNDRYQDSLMGSPGDVEADHPFSGYCYFYNAGGTSIFPQAMGQIQMERSNGDYYGFGFSGSYNTAISNFNGFTITNNGGPNISSGNFKLYGLK
jgi:hypothetical protein